MTIKLREQATMQMTYDMYAISHSIRSSIDAALLRRCTSKNDDTSTRSSVNLNGYCGCYILTGGAVAS